MICSISGIFEIIVASVGLSHSNMSNYISCFCLLVPISLIIIAKFIQVDPFVILDPTNELSTLLRDSIDQIWWP